MSRSVLVRGARQLLTLHGPMGPRRGDALRELGIIEDGSVLVTDGAIVNVGPTRRIENLAEARSAEEIDANGRVVMPGFCDPYVRLIGPPARTIDYPLGLAASEVTGSELTQAAFTYLKSTSPNRLEFQARRLVDRLIRHGTTSIEAKSGYGLDEPAELKSLRVAAAVGNCLNIVPTFVARAPSAQFDGRTDLHLDWLCAELLPRIRQKHLAICVEIVCDPAGMTIDDARTFLAAAGRLGFVLKLEAEQTTRMGAVRLASETDVRSISGMNFCDQFDAEILSRSRTIALLLPARSFQGQTTKSPPARLLIDSGVAVALGSGHSPALPATFSMQPVLSIACSELEMTPEEAISAATINAAHAMNRASISGSLEFGKEADLVVLDVPDYREIPYHLGVNYVAVTMRRGQVVYREGSVTCSGE